MQMGLLALSAGFCPGLSSRLVSREFSDADLAAYRRLDFADWIAPDRCEFYRQWGRGVAYDATIPLV
jgi:hypothetical protein